MKNFKWLAMASMVVLMVWGCSEENLQPVDKEKSQSTRKSSLINSCECSIYLDVEQGIPSFLSREDFRDAYNCLTEAHDNWLDEIEANYPNITSEEFDLLVEEGVINEWKIFDDFASHGNYYSLFRKDLIEEDNWLENGAIISDAPEDIVGDEVLKAMINQDGEVKIGGVIINVRSTLMTYRSLELCTPYQARSEYFYNSDASYKTRLAGGIGYVPILGSFVYGKITAYKKKKNGRWKRNRENLSVAATCNVRRSPLNSCKFLTIAPTGWKSKKNKSITITKWNWFSLQIWYKRAYATNSTSPDGLVNGYSDNVSSSGMGF